MAPFCWVVFHYENLYPREGYFLWILGMLLALFSPNLAIRRNQRGIQGIATA
jgi:hypothetical protein